MESIPPAAISGSTFKLIDGMVSSEPPRAASNSAFVHSLDNSKLILSVDKNFAKFGKLAFRVSIIWLVSSKWLLCRWFIKSISTFKVQTTHFFKPTIGGGPPVPTTLMANLFWKYTTHNDFTVDLWPPLKIYDPQWFWLLTYDYFWMMHKFRRLNSMLDRFEMKTVSQFSQSSCPDLGFHIPEQLLLVWQLIRSR